MRLLLGRICRQMVSVQDMHSTKFHDQSKHIALMQRVRLVHLGILLVPRVGFSVHCGGC